MQKAACLLLVFSIEILLAAASFAQAPGGPYHPMDALTPLEIQAGVRLLAKAGLVDGKTRFADARLEEPPKADVLTWTRGQPFERNAYFIFRRNRETFDALRELVDASGVLSE